MKLPPVQIPHDFHHEGEPIVLIEYARKGAIWMPHSVFTSAAPKHPNYCNCFDFYWCRRDAVLFYHKSGSGGAPYLNGWPDAKRTYAKVWWNPELGGELRTGGGEKINDFLSLGFEYLADPMELGGSTEQNPFEYGCEGEVVYCTKCKDHIPEDNLCEHIFWCERCNEWGGAEGNKERCRHRKPSFE